ncbi:unnamed protein product [Lupinus luteus]|uniref:Protein POLLENLESS 3-LIKE 2 n=1 Tax=Lupinus luteus TaxID=3873 RepID=A0AAV1YCK4_LUPLU
MQDTWNGAQGLRASKSAPCSPLKPVGVSRTRSESLNVTHKVPVGATPYVRAKTVQLVDKDPERAIPLFWAAINAGDRVDSALKDMAIVMKQQNRSEEAIQAIKSLRSRCSDQAQESLDNILLDLYKRCGKLDDQIALLKHKLFLIKRGLAFNGKRTKTARSQGKKFQVSVEQEATRLLGNLGWALMQQNNYIEAEGAYLHALSIAPDNNKMCNLGICLMKQGRISEAKETLYRVKKPVVNDGPKGSDSHLKAYERAQQMLEDLESDMMNKGFDRIEQSKIFEAFLGSSSIWQPQPCKDHTNSTSSAKAANSFKTRDEFADENVNSNTLSNRAAPQPPPPPQYNNNNNKVAPNTTSSTKAANSFKTRDEFADENVNSNTISNRAAQHNNNKVAAMLGNSLNVAAPPFHACNENQSLEKLKRTRRVSSKEDSEKDKLIELLPDNKDFEDAILGALLCTPNSSSNTTIFKTKTNKRLKVFQDITLSMSPRA